MPYTTRPSVYPQFCIIGFKEGGFGVSLKVSREFYELNWNRIEMVGEESYEISLKMYDVVEVTGRDYDECFAQLFGQWSPTSDEKSSEKREQLPLVDVDEIMARCRVPVGEQEVGGER